MAVLAHLSGYAGYLIPCGGVIAPLVLIFTAKSARIVAIAKQALSLNVLGFLAVLASIVFAQLAGLALRGTVMLWVLVGLGALCAIAALGLIVLCPLIGAVKATQGEYFRYPLFGVKDPGVTSATS